jgi:hypothetical protein
MGSIERSSNANIFVCNIEEYFRFFGKITSVMDCDVQGFKDHIQVIKWRYSSLDLLDHMLKRNAAVKDTLQAYCKAWQLKCNKAKINSYIQKVPYYPNIQR